MKISLGNFKILFMIFFSIILLHAEGFEYTLEVNKQSPYVKEAVIVTLDIKQTDYSKVMLFDFTPTKSKDYTFYLLSAKEKDSYQNTKVHYAYLIYPLKAGKIQLTFQLTQKVTTAQNVVYSFSGDKENTKVLTTNDTRIDLAPLKLHVKPLPEGTQLVGDFTIKNDIQSHEAKSYEPVPMSIEIKGTGFPPKLDDLFASTQTYTLFKERPQIKRTKSDKGISSVITYPMAISAKQSFTFDVASIKAFDPTTEKSYMLSLPPEDFKITEVARENLVDQVDSPKPMEQMDWSWLGTLLGYLVVFFAGFLTAKSVQWQKRVQHKENPFSVQIAQTDDPKVLLALLMAQDSKKYAAAIEILEAHLYEGKKLNLNELKRELPCLTR